MREGLLRSVLVLIAMIAFVGFSGCSSTSTDRTFAQGVWRGRDPRITYRNGFYYHVEVGRLSTSRNRIYKSKSLIDRGQPRLLPKGFPLVEPEYIESLNGVNYQKWYAIGNAVWECQGDPYDCAPDGWRKIKRIPYVHWGFDYFVFQAETGPYAGEFFIVWAGQEREDDPSTPKDERKSWWFENIYISRIISLQPDQPTLENPDCTPANRVVSYRPHTSKPMQYPVHKSSAGAWKDVVAEAPAVVQKDGTISIIYSGDGAQTVHYALGIAFCKDGDVLNPDSWVDWNHHVNPGPEFRWDFDKGVYGPGVARVVPSPDGKEDWMFYHAKVWNTWNHTESASEESQSIQEMWTRYINLKKIGWKKVIYEGREFTIPDMGEPDGPGTRLKLPSGDPGITPKDVFKVEAEGMIPFGYVMSKGIQDLVGDPYPTVVLKIEDARASEGGYMGRFDKLAAEAADLKSGLLYRNTPGGSRLIVCAASPLDDPSFDLYVNGAFRRTLKLVETGSWNKFRENEFAVNVPLGAEIRLVYEHGKNVNCNVDYIILKGQ